MRRRHAYIVKWRDSTRVYGWHEIGASYQASEVTTIGWLIRKTPQHITLTTSISDGGTVIDPMTIPREAVTKMTRLKQYVTGS